MEPGEEGEYGEGDGVRGGRGEGRSCIPHGSHDQSIEYACSAIVLAFSMRFRMTYGIRE